MKDFESQQSLLPSSTSNSQSVFSQSGLQSFLEVGGLVSVWYIFAVLAVTSSKEIMNRVPFPFLLCTVQFGFASVLSNLFLKYYNLQQEIPETVHHYLHKISFTYTVAFVLTNWGFQIGKNIYVMNIISLFFSALSYSCIY